MHLEYGLKELPLLVDKLKSYMINNELIVLLRGDLSSGKSTLVAQFVHSYDASIKVTSPTFTILHEYPIVIADKPVNIYHYDLYRKQWQELLAMGFLDIITDSGIHFVEWSCDELEQLLNNTDVPVVLLHITMASNTKRTYHIRLINAIKNCCKDE